MKIGITCYPTYGGSGVVASELGMGLAERGHEVHFITYAVPGRLNVYREGIYFHQVTVPEYPLFEYAPYSLALASHIAECTERIGLDLIHAHYAIPHAASALMAREMVGDRLKVITTLHGTDITLVGRDASFMPVTKYAIEKSDAVSAVSMFLHDEVCCVFTCDRKIDMIYNSIDPRFYSEIDGRRLRQRFAPGGEKLLVHVSNFRPVKRVFDVFDIFLRIRKRIAARLVLVGSGPDLRELESMAVENGVERDLVILGNRESVADVTAAADLMLLPSQTESFGLVALESLACMTPVIATDAGGLPEVIDHGVTGYLAPVGDTETMADYALQLLEDDIQLKQMGEAGRKTAFEKFNLDTMLDKYEALYLRAKDVGG